MPLPDMLTEVEHEHEAATLIALLGMSCLGGVVKWLRNPNHKKRTLLTFATCSMTAGFVGLMAHFFMTWLGVDMSLQFAISGAAGYSGGILLDATVPFLWRLIYEKFGTFGMPVKQEAAGERQERHESAGIDQEG